MDSRPMPLDLRPRQPRSFIRPSFSPIPRPIFRRFPDPHRCNPTSSPPHASPPLPGLRLPRNCRTTGRLSSRRAQPDTRSVALDFPGSIPYPATVAAPPVSGRVAFTIGSDLPNQRDGLPPDVPRPSPTVAPFLHPPLLRPHPHDRSFADSPIRTAATRQARHPTRPHRCPGFGQPGTAGPPSAYQAGALNPIPVLSRLTSLARFLSLHS